MAVIRHPKDFYAGLLFTGIGIAAIVLASQYQLGTAAKMGPGYFPRGLGMLLTVLGAVLVVRSLRIQGTAIPPWNWRSTCVILGSVVLFGLVVEKLGLAASTLGLIVFASTASPEFRLKEAVLSGLFFALLAVGVFIVGLKLQLPIWPIWLASNGQAPAWIS
jgi:hypothetical protein